MFPSTRLLSTLLLVALYVYAIPHVLPRAPSFPSIPSNAEIPTNHGLGRRQSGSWTLVQNGTTGVSAMMIIVVSPTLVLILDKVEHNALLTPNGNPAWGSLYNMQTNTATAVSIQTNTLCAGGAFISNGTFVSTGGSGFLQPWETEEGWQGVRLFNPCTSPSGSGCSIYEDIDTVHMLDRRWYPTTIRLYDGTAMVIGGSREVLFYNEPPEYNAASYEYWPKKFWMQQSTLVPSDFLVRTAPANLFPIAYALTNGQVFLAANNKSIVYDTDYNYEIVLPEIPNGYRLSYPFTAGSALLPLIPPYYICEILVCGGTNTDDRTPPSQQSSQTPTSDKCFRMVLTQAGVDAGWIMETMPERRVMADLVTMPNGEIIILNGARKGAAANKVFPDAIGQSLADDPVLQPTRYDPFAALGSRFSKTGMPTSNINRVYHSVATLTPMGNIMIAGSNPNDDVALAADYPGYPYPTEYRVEWLNPPYMTGPRPVLTNPPTQMNFNTAYTFTTSIPTSLTGTVYVTFMDIGFVTHSIHATDRLVLLNHQFNNANRTSITVTSPRDGGVYPPGPGWLFITVGSSISEGKRVMIGTGGSPPVPYF